ncbi:hypothetical protein AMTR_s00132p00049380 [Amborella trichopoda]|uniref:Uncharacterized protein n=1 Tax=Amborella trichopoda TaxID=13333 RepID=W1NE62_AMBTC|nr:hypothetical protein AMTR_s00132p00049380 [Amborella trichopoda]
MGSEVETTQASTFASLEEGAVGDIPVVHEPCLFERKSFDLPQAWRLGRSLTHFLLRHPQHPHGYRAEQPIRHEWRLRATLSHEKARGPQGKSP